MMNSDFDALFNHVYDVRDCELLVYKKGKVTVKTKVNESCCNPYGMAHGGFLYTLCDNTAGLLGYSLGSYIVTMQSSISYLSGAKCDDELVIEAEVLHDGRSSKVCEVSITSADRLICKATFTLFPVKKIEE